MITLTYATKSIDLSTLACDLRIDTEDQYADGYHQVATAIHAGTNLNVVVTNVTVARWFKLMAARYGATQVRYQEVTLRSQLEAQIGIAIPAEVQDSEIQASELMELKIPASGQNSFADYLLDVFLGSFLTRPYPLFRVNEILAAYEPDTWEAALKRPLVYKAFQNWLRAHRAALKDNTEWQAERALLDWFADSPAVYFRQLSGLKLLAGYPEELGERVYGPAYRKLIALGLDLRRVPVVLKDNQPVLDEIRMHLNRLSQPEPEALETLFEQVSGALEIELETVINLLRSGKIEVTPPLIRRVQRKFEALRAQPHLAQALSDLEMLITVRKPSRPQPDWNTEAWMRWAVEEYLPYRFWLENTGKLDDNIGELAGLYADWLFQNYGQLRYNDEHMAWKATLNLKQHIKTHPGPVLIVMVDNFNLKFYPILKSVLGNQHFFEQSLQYCLSMLPSFTEVSKKCIITGHYKPFQVGSYSEVVVKTWNSKLNKKVCYLANISELRRVTRREHEVYILNYLPIDYTLHQEDSHTGISHPQVVRVYLDALAHDIRAFARRLGAERDLLVIFISDHGSTRIPSGTVNVIEHKLYSKHALDEHHRYLSLSDGEVRKLADQVKYECYLFRRSEHDLPENYLVARRLYRFKKTDDSVYIHGGLTPEETIIPLAIYEPVMVTPRLLKVHLVEPKKILAGTRPDLTFEITNPNSYPLENLTFEIVDPNLEAIPQQIESLQQLERCPLKLKARCPSSADISSKYIQVELSFEFMGQKYSQTVKAPAVFDTLFKTRFDQGEF